MKFEFTIPPQWLKNAAEDGESKAYKESWVKSYKASHTADKCNYDFSRDQLKQSYDAVREYLRGLPSTGPFDCANITQVFKDAENSINEKFKNSNINSTIKKIDTTRKSNEIAKSKKMSQEEFLDGAGIERIFENGIIFD